MAARFRKELAPYLKQSGEGKRIEAWLPHKATNLIYIDYINTLSYN
jgi:hypothetical protein